ncbi:hypothetical protein [Amycolatopsis ultiminotia]
MSTEAVLCDLAATLDLGVTEAAVRARLDAAPPHEALPLVEVRRAFWTARDEHLPLGGAGSFFRGSTCAWLLVRW